MANKFSSYIPYVPGPSPGEMSLGTIIRSIWDEFFKVSQSMVDIDRPVSLSLGSNEPLNATTTPGTWVRLFNGGEASQWEQPTGTFNHSTGVYKVATEGLYQVFVSLNVPPFPSAQTKDYRAQIQFTIDFIEAGKLNYVVIKEDGGLDTHYLSVMGQIMYPLYQGDQIYVDARLIREAGAATGLACTATLQIVRMSGIR
jgi:hypothetical protein